MSPSRRNIHWVRAGWFLCALAIALALPFRYRALTETSPTYDEPSRLFLSVFYAQTGRWYEGDIHPPVFSWIVARLAPRIAPFRDAEAFSRNPRDFHNLFQYRLDLFSGLPGDLAIVRLRGALQTLFLVLLASSLLLTRHLKTPRWGQVTLLGFLLLEPTILGLTTLVSNDFAVCAFLLLATALGVREGRAFFCLASLVFALAWGTKFTSLFWAVPLALGIYSERLPKRCLAQWALGGALGYLLTTALGGFDSALGPVQAPNFRLTYLDGVHLLRTPLVYFLQAVLCKSSLALLGLLGLNVFLVVKMKKADRLRPSVLIATLTGSLLAVSLILPGLGVRLVLPLLLTVLICASSAVDSPKVAATFLLLLLAESSLHYDRWLAYQNPLAGGEPRLLDSNCDWGQGLKQLARWRAAHPEGELALALFGPTLPETYRLTEYRTLPSAPPLPPEHLALEGGVFKGWVAVSRNFLYGYMVDDWNLKSLKARQPLTCFQDALCLYDVREAASR